MAEPAVHPEARVHSTAHIDPTARIAAGAIIEAGASVGPNCVIGPRTRIRTSAVIVEHTTLGEDNDVHPCAVLGGDPQDKAFKGDPRGELIIGDRNVFREHCTFNRATQNGPPTRVGSGNYFMAAAHAGHNAQIADNCIFANGAVIGGHARIGSGVVMSAFCAVHQFTLIGDGVMFQGGAMVGMHVPPYMVLTAVNSVAGINRVGMRRNPALNAADREDIKNLVRLIYRERGGRNLAEYAAATLESRRWGTAGTNFLRFILSALAEQPPRARGICGMRGRGAASED